MNQTKRASQPPPSETQMKKPLRPLTKSKDSEEDVIVREPHKVIIEQKPDGVYHMRTVLGESEEEDLSNAVELNGFEYELFEQYKEACATFNALCISKLAKHHSAIYNLMSRIYDVFEKYGIDSGHRDEFILEFTRDDLHIRPRHLRVGNGKFRGIFYYSGWTLRFNLSEKVPYSSIGKRIKLVNGELSAFEYEFRKVVLRSRPISDGQPRRI